MIVVSDTTPLITLMKAEKLDILYRLFGEVIIPEAVFSEVTGNKSFKAEADIIRNSDYIKVVKVKNGSQVSFLQRATGLDLGESEAIICADETKADLLLMDEAAGRRVAQNMKLPITGSTGILIRAFQEGIITREEADDAFDRIRNANRHISERLINMALDIIHSKEWMEFKTGEDFSELPETFVIFITENDVFGKGKSLYRVERRIEETNEPFDDGEHIIYVNGADKDASTALGKLMHDFFCTDPDDMNYKELADKVRYFKENEEGVATMCKVMEDMRNEAAKTAVEKDRTKNALEMLADGLSIEKVAKYSQLAIERVKELAMAKTAQ